MEAIQMTTLNLKEFMENYNLKDDTNYESEFKNV